MLVLKLFLVPVMIALATVCGKRWGVSVAGFISGLPIVAGPILWFIYLENGSAFAQSAAVATLGGIIALSSFCFSYAWLCKRFYWPVSLVFSLSIYALLAFILPSLALMLGVVASLVLIVLLLQIYVSPALDQQSLSAPATVAEIGMRMLLAAILVLLVTYFAAQVGATYSGVLAVFPVAGTTIAVFSHRNYSAQHAIGALRAMQYSLLSMWAFFVVVATSAGSLGFSMSFLWGIIAALGLQLPLWVIRSRYNTRPQAVGSNLEIEN